jgi:transposase
MALLARRPVNVAIVALANKMARVIWVVLVRSQVYRTAA